MTDRRKHDSDSDMIESLKARLADPNDYKTYGREEVAALLYAYEVLRERISRIVKISDS